MKEFTLLACQHLDTQIVSGKITGNDASAIREVFSELETLKASLKIATEALEKVARYSHLTIFIEEPSHVADFFKPVTDALAALKTPTPEGKKK